ncbi:MAG TPA: hypothetical protein VIM02_05355 [Rhizomicrobium sp.]|jgi:hypothetical protein
MREFLKSSVFQTSFLCASLILAGVAAVVAEKADAPPTAAQRADVGPIAFTGHGGIFDASGRQIVPTPAFVRLAQDTYRKILMAQLDTKQRAAFTAVERSLLSGLKLDTQSQLVADNYLVDWLALTVATPQSGSIRGFNGVLRLNMHAALPEKTFNLRESAKRFQLNDALRSRINAALKAWPKPPKVFFLSTSTDGPGYRAECAANGVPIPPDIGTPDTTTDNTVGWKSRGMIPRDELFIVRGIDAEVMTYHSTSPEGMCVALPRYDSADNIVQLDGIICMGKVSKKVCFWDNEKLGTVNTFPLYSSGTTRTIVPFTSFGGGSEIAKVNGGNGGQCSACHAGENPYIVHGAALYSMSAAGLPTMPDDWHDPIVPVDTPAWPQNPGPMNSPGSCNGCHGIWNARQYAGRLPHISNALFDGILGGTYCNAVLKPALGALDPSGGPVPKPTMPLGIPGSATCTPGIASTNVNYRACGASHTATCSPAGTAGTPSEVRCTPDAATLIGLCGTAPAADASSRGDPHLTTFNGTYYDFQSAGEFTALRHFDGMEVQTRQSPVATAVVPVTSDYTGLASCVSLNTAFAARVGPRRVTYEPDPGREGQPGSMVVRIDGRVVTVPAGGLNLGGGGRIVNAATGTGIEIFFPNGTDLIVTSNYWPPHNAWYLNVDVVRTVARDGTMGTTLPGSWLPLLADGTALGDKPASLHARWVDLNVRLANSWRVTNATSLFDYAPGVSTATYTNRNWPVENPVDCKVAGQAPVKPMDPKKAESYCGKIADRVRHAQCVFDVTYMGDPVFARGYMVSQAVNPGRTRAPR